MSENYTDFAIDTAKQIVTEENEKFEKVIQDDIVALMESWCKRLMTNVETRLDQLGFQQDLEVTVSWDIQEMPTFSFRGTTNTGVSSEQD